MAFDPTPLHEILDYFSWPVILAFAWRLSGRLTAIETTLKLILTNHLPHIQAAIDDRNAKERNAE